MKIVMFSTKEHDRRFFEEANRGLGDQAHSIEYLDARLASATTSLADGFDAVCVFVNDSLDASVVSSLAEYGVKAIALRCAGFNNVDLKVAKQSGIHVVRVPEYSPHAVAEHSVALLLALNRQIHRAYNRVRDGDFRLAGLLGFDLFGKTVGVIGTGKIGRCVCRILSGFGCEVIASDPLQHPECLQMGVEYTELSELFRRSRIVVLQCPLLPETHHLIDEAAIAKMPPDVMIINTSRGAVIDTRAVIEGLKRGRIGGLGIDVYEEEADLFFEDLSSTVITDDVFARLLTFPNVIITGHQAFFTHEALDRIASVTLQNLLDIEMGLACPNIA
ncbi:MAG: 2-hydroxyacid dehydrogenase [Planctomycetota bacterium]